MKNTNLSEVISKRRLRKLRNGSKPFSADILSIIFGFLTQRDLGIARLVCIVWYVIATRYHIQVIPRNVGIISVLQFHRKHKLPLGAISSARSGSCDLLRNPGSVIVDLVMSVPERVGSADEYIKWGADLSMLHECGNTLSLCMLKIIHGYDCTNLACSLIKLGIKIERDFLTQVLLRFESVNVCELAELLIESGSEIDPLIIHHMLEFSDDIPTVNMYEFLVDNGWDINVQDERGHTVYDKLMQIGNPYNYAHRIANYLGARSGVKKD